MKKSLAVKRFLIDSLGKSVSKLIDGINQNVKTDIAEAAFFTFNTEEQVKKLFNVLKAEPNGNQLIMKLDMRLYMCELRYAVLDCMVDLIFGGYTE